MIVGGSVWSKYMHNPVRETPEEVARANVLTAIDSAEGQEAQENLWSHYLGYRGNVADTLHELGYGLWDIEEGEAIYDQMLLERGINLEQLYEEQRER